jgi:hypothetical protein
MERKLKIASEDQRLVFGEVYVPNVPDSDGEFMDAAGIQDMAYRFMKNLRLKSIDVSHSNRIVDGCCVIESFLARKGDPDFVEGAWVVGAHIEDDETWAKIKKGDINGFSMEAFVTRDPVLLEVDVPPVLSGKTLPGQKADDAETHVHDFYVSYGPDGSFLGGRTNMVNGHFHVIKRGTVTDEAAHHRHRFAHIDIFKSAEGLVEKADISNADLSTAGKKNPEQGRRYKKQTTLGLARFLK